MHSINSFSRAATVFALCCLFLFVFGSGAIGGELANSQGIVPSSNPNLELKIDEYQTILKADPGNVQLYRDYADCLFEMQKPQVEVINLFRKGFDHFIANSEDMEGVTRLGMLLIGQTKNRSPSTAQMTMKRLLQKTKGQALTQEQKARIQYIELSLSANSGVSVANR